MTIRFRFLSPRGILEFLLVAIRFCGTLLSCLRLLPFLDCNPLSSVLIFPDLLVIKIFLDRIESLLVLQSSNLFLLLSHLLLHLLNQI